MLIELVVLTLSSDEDANNETVHTEHTSHDSGDDRLEEKVWLQDGDGHNTDTGFSSSVGSTQVGEDEGGDDSHGAEEEGLVGVTKVYSHSQISIKIKIYKSV